MTNKIISFIFLLFIGFVVGFLSRPQTIVNDIIEYKRDTITILQPPTIQVDTFYKETRVPIKVTHIEHDTIHRVDSVMVYLPYERKVYKDSTYRAVVSGYEPFLEEIDVYSKQTTIYIEKIPPLLSPYVSGSVGLNGDVAIGGGVFIRGKDAFGIEYGNRGLGIKYIHKF